MNNVKRKLSLGLVGLLLGGCSIVDATKLSEIKSEFEGNSQQILQEKYTGNCLNESGEKIDFTNPQLFLGVVGIGSTIFSGSSTLFNCTSATCYAIMVPATAFIGRISYLTTKGITEDKAYCTELAKKLNKNM